MPIPSHGEISASKLRVFRVAMPQVPPLQLKMVRASNGNLLQCIKSFVSVFLAPGQPKDYEWHQAQWCNHLGRDEDFQEMVLHSF